MIVHACAGGCILSKETLALQTKPKLKGPGFGAATNPRHGRWNHATLPRLRPMPVGSCSSCCRPCRAPTRHARDHHRTRR